MRISPWLWFRWDGRTWIGPTATDYHAGSSRAGQKLSPAELAGLVQALADLEAALLKQLDRLKRGVLSEPEFTKANKAARSQTTAL